MPVPNDPATTNDHQTHPRLNTMVRILLPPYWKLAADIDSFSPLLSQQKSLPRLIPSLSDLLSGQHVLLSTVHLGTELIASRR